MRNGQNTDAGGVLFGLKSSCLSLRGVQRHILGLQCHSSGCNFWLEWFISINGTDGTCQMSIFGDGNDARCSMGPKWSLERVFFSLKSPSLRGVQRQVLGLQYHPSDCDFRLVWFIRIDGTQGVCLTSRFGDGGHAKSSMGPERWLEVVLFWRKISMSEGGSVATYGIHSYPSDCKFRL